MQKIKSQEEAMTVAMEIAERMYAGDVVSGNSIRIEKLDSGKVRVSGSEYNFNQTDRKFHDTPTEMHDVEVGLLIFWPERRRVNDALERVEEQLVAIERELFDRLA